MAFGTVSRQLMFIVQTDNPEILSGCTFHELVSDTAWQHDMSLLGATPSLQGNRPRYNVYRAREMPFLSRMAGCMLPSMWKRNLAQLGNATVSLQTSGERQDIQVGPSAPQQRLTCMSVSMSICTQQTSSFLPKIKCKKTSNIIKHHQPSIS